MTSRLSWVVVSFLVSLLNFGFGRANAQTQYTADGAPTGLEEEIRWRVNRGRFDSASENQTRGTAYSDVPAAAGPLAPNQSLTLAARHQSEDMATHNVFQHATVTGSAYYNPVTQPNPWDRMTAEGYIWNNAGENIAAGYGSAEAVYLGWWNSTGHRQNMYNSALREIGDGYYYSASSTYRSYYTMDLGSSGSSSFFTDTLFRDTNGNGVYDQGEGVTGVAVKLVAAGTLVGSFDISTAVGSFAVPLQSIASGVLTQVLLSNTTAASVTLTIPQTYSTSSSLTLVAGEQLVYGTFTKPASAQNVGLRNLSVSAPAVVRPSLAATRSGLNMLLQWPSAVGQQYQPQYTTNLVSWFNLTPNSQAGTGSPLSYTDSSAAGAGARFYRLLVWRP
jgi:hypothetical protein